MRLPSLDVFKKHAGVVLRNMADRHEDDGLGVGRDDLRCLSHCNDSMVL